MSRPYRAARIAATVVATWGVLALSACASAPPPRPAGEFTDRSEKTLYAALRESEASIEQRKQILQIYDAHHPRMKTLDEQTARTIDEWHALDPHSPDYPHASSELADKFGRIVGDRVRETSAMQSEIAAVLDAGQWTLFIDRWNEEGGGSRDGGERRGGGGGGGRGRR